MDVLCRVRRAVSDSPFRGLEPARRLCPRGFSRQEDWSGLPFPSPGYLPEPGIKPRSPTLQADSLPSDPPGMELQPQYITTRTLLAQHRKPSISPLQMAMLPLHAL